MEKEAIEKKCCENCRYYSRYYSKQRTKFDIVYCGHCLNSNKKTLPLFVCGHWEETAAPKAERKKLIIKTLEAVCERLNQIAAILQDDEE